MKTNDILEYIKKAGKLRQKCTIGYYNARGVFSTRTISPYSLRLSKKGLLLFGLENEDQHIKSFKVENITDIQVSEFKFEPVFPVEL